MLFCRLLIFFQKHLFFEKLFQEYCQSIKQFGSRSGPTFCRLWSKSKLFAKFISRRHWLAKSEYTSFSIGIHVTACPINSLILDVNFSKEGTLKSEPASHDFCPLPLSYLIVLGKLYCKQYGPRSDCSQRAV